MTHFYWYDDKTGKLEDVSTHKTVDISKTNSAVQSGVNTSNRIYHSHHSSHHHSSSSNQQSVMPQSSSTSNLQMSQSSTPTFFNQNTLHSNTSSNTSSSTNKTSSTSGLQSSQSTTPTFFNQNSLKSKLNSGSLNSSGVVGASQVASKNNTAGVGSGVSSTSSRSSYHHSHHRSYTPAPVKSNLFNNVSSSTGKQSVDLSLQKKINANKQSNAKLSQVNKAVGNVLATNFALQHSIAGLNPLSSALMENQAVSDLNQAVTNAQIRPSSQSTTKTFFNQNTLHRPANQQVQNNQIAMAVQPFTPDIKKSVNRLNKNINTINKINSQPLNPLQQTVQSVKSDGQFIAQSYKNAGKALTGKRPPFLSDSAHKTVRQAQKDFSNLPSPIATGIGVAAGVSQDIMTGLSSVPVGVFNLGKHIWVSEGKEIPKGWKKNGLLGAVESGVADAGMITAETLVGTGAWLVSAPANLVTQPFNTGGQIAGAVIMGKAVEGVSDMIDSTGLTKAGRIKKAVTKLNTEPIEINTYPRTMENWNDINLKVNKRGNIVVKNAKLQKGAFKVNNELSASRDAMVKALGTKPVSSVEFPNVKSMNYPEGLKTTNPRWHISDVKNKIVDTRLTHTTKPTPITDYFGKGKTIVKKGVIKSVNQGKAVIGSESGSVWVNTVFGKKPMSFAKEFAVNLEKQGKSFVTQKLDLFEKGKPVYSKVSKYTVAQSNFEPNVLTITSPTANIPLGKQGMRQVAVKEKLFTFNKGNGISTKQVTTTRLDTTAVAGKSTSYNRITGNKITEKHIPVELKLTKGKAKLIEPASIDLSPSNPDVVNYVKKPRLVQYKDINTKMVGHGVLNPKDVLNNVKIQSQPSMLDTVGQTMTQIAKSKKANLNLISRQTTTLSNGYRYVSDSVTTRSPSGINLATQTSRAVHSITPTIADVSSSNVIQNVAKLSSVSSTNTSFNPQPLSISKQKLINSPQLNVGNSMSIIQKSSTKTNTKSSQTTRKVSTAIAISTPKISSVSKLNTIPKTTTTPKTTTRLLPTLRIGGGHKVTSRSIVKKQSRHIQANIPITIPKIDIKPIQKTPQKQKRVVKRKQIPKMIQLNTPKYNPKSQQLLSGSLMTTGGFGFGFDNMGFDKPLVFGHIGLSGKPKTQRKPKKMINQHKVKPFADLLSISLMDYTLNKNKQALRYKIAKQPTMRQFKKWKPFFKMTSPVLPTRRMLSSKNKYSNIFASSGVKKWF